MRSLVLALLALLGTSAAQAQSVESFYRGRTINLVVGYSVGGLPPNRLFRLFEWNADGRGTNVEIGFMDSGPSGSIQLAAPAHAVFALTDTSLGPLPW